MKIAVTGVTGVGKSSWINQFRGLTEGHPNAAAIVSGLVECTSQVTLYEFEEIPTLLLGDLPGADTKGFPIESYYEDTKMETYDAFVMLTQGRIMRTDNNVMDLIAWTGKPCYFGYTHIDELIMDAHGNLTTSNLKAQKIRDEMTTLIQNSSITPHQWGGEVFLLTDKPERDMGGWTPDNDKLKETILDNLKDLILERTEAEERRREEQRRREEDRKIEEERRRGEERRREEARRARDVGGVELLRSAHQYLGRPGRESWL